jgi:hypothetical protein
VFRTTDGVPYYFNKKTQETKWDKPDALKTAAEKDQKVSLEKEIEKKGE